VLLRERSGHCIRRTSCQQHDPRKGCHLEDDYDIKVALKRTKGEKKRRLSRRCRTAKKLRATRQTRKLIEKQIDYGRNDRQ
jgi:hypothetical protein